MHSALRTPDNKFTPTKRPEKNTPLATKRIATSLFPFLLEYEYEDQLIQNPQNKSQRRDVKSVEGKSNSYKPLL